MRGGSGYLDPLWHRCQDFGDNGALGDNAEIGNNGAIGDNVELKGHKK